MRYAGPLLTFHRTKDEEDHPLIKKKLAGMYMKICSRALINVIGHTLYVILQLKKNHKQRSNVFSLKLEKTSINLL